MPLNRRETAASPQKGKDVGQLPPGAPSVPAPSDERAEWSGDGTETFTNLGMVLVGIFVAQQALDDYLHGRGFADRGRLLSSMLAGSDLPAFAALWAAMGCVYLCALPLQVWFTRHPRMPMAAQYLVQHSLQATIILGAVGVTYAREWGVMPTISFTMQAMVCFMKMHSFFEVNRTLNGAVKPGQRAPTDHLTLFRFLEFSFMPTLVYAPSFPRTAAIRLDRLLTHVLGCFGALTCLYILNVRYTIPLMESDLAQLDQTPLETLNVLLKLSLPFTANFLLVYVVIFENICNGLAEITRFAPRRFYGPWWLSTSWDQFARRWNRPVHEFLLKHVYLECIGTFRLPKSAALFVTFLFSALLHEVIVVAALRAVRLFLFGLMLFQIPLIYIAKPFERRRAGNLIFWFGMAIGPSMLIVLYLRSIDINALPSTA